MSDSGCRNVTKWRYREHTEAVMIVASWAVIGSSTYMRGRMDGSSMSVTEFSEYAAQHGPYWPLVLFGVGMVVLAAAILVMWRYHNG